MPWFNYKISVDDHPQKKFIEGLFSGNVHITDTVQIDHLCGRLRQCLREMPENYDEKPLKITLNRDEIFCLNSC